MAKRNNNGYWFTFEDGCHGWTAGWSAWEKKVQEREHGKLVRYVPA